MSRRRVDQGRGERPPLPPTPPPGCPRAEFFTGSDRGGGGWRSGLCLWLVAAVAGSATPALAQRLSAEVECRRTTDTLAYDCRILLKDGSTGQPIRGAAVSVGADMPSMPMAHNVRPVEATPGEGAGEYHARIQLEMFGEWALRLSVSGPARDVIVRKLRFLPAE